MNHRSAPPAWLPAALCAACGMALFQFLGNANHGYIHTDSLFYWWGYQWVNPSSETEHGWLVLGLSLFMLRRNLGRTPAGPAADGLALGAMLGGLALHGLGFVGQQARVSILGLLLFAWGVAALGGGSRWARASAFPLGYLVFAVPVNALDSIGFWLRMGVVKVGGSLAHAAGVAVLRSGTQLVAPDGRYHYDVAAACSGVRSLVALGALSLFIGYLWLRPAWLRAAVLAACVPLVFLGNVLRICSIIAAAQVGGQRWGEVAHDVMGFGVFIVVLGGVVALAEWIVRVRPDWGTREPTKADPGPALRAGAAGLWIAAGVVAAAGAEAAFLAKRASSVAPERSGVLLAPDGANPVALPSFLGTRWMGRTIEPGPVERSILPPDTGFSRKLYISREGPADEVLLSIVLSGRDRTSIHRPEICLVGQGWSIEGSETRVLRYPGRTTGGINATVLRVQREAVVRGAPRPPPDIVVYWFVGGGRTVASPFGWILVDAWSRIASGTADRWAYVLLQTPAPDGEGRALERIQSVLDAALPVFEPPPPP